MLHQTKDVTGDVFAGGEFTDGSYEARSDNSESWDTSKEKPRRRRF
jgi:hypothetical protein